MKCEAHDRLRKPARVCVILLMAWSSAAFAAQRCSPQERPEDFLEKLKSDTEFQKKRFSDPFEFTHIAPVWAEQPEKPMGKQRIRGLAKDISSPGHWFFPPDHANGYEMTHTVVQQGNKLKLRAYQKEGDVINTTFWAKRVQGCWILYRGSGWIAA